MIAVQDKGSGPMVRAPFCGQRGRSPVGLTRPRSPAMLAGIMTLLSDRALVERIFDHIDNRTTDCVDSVWREPVAHYLDPDCFAAERAGVMRRHATLFCPSAALPQTGSYVARDAAGVPVVAVRGKDGAVRAFRNSCRHRGATLVEGEGCAKALVCPYHAWTYALDGTLAGIPDAYGFPGLDKADHGLVPLKTVERYGFVFVTQDGEAEPGPELDVLAGMIDDSWRLVSATTTSAEANWKLIAEGFLEGYHIRSTHRESFYPVQYHNLNVIEAFGPNNRITFPYRKLERQRERPREQWTGAGALTTVYHLFPNVMIPTFPQTVNVTIIEPVSLDRSNVVSYILTSQPEGSEGAGLVDVSREFVNRGFAEDLAMTAANQRGLASGANSHLTFGLYEGAIGHLHAELAARLERG